VKPSNLSLVPTGDANDAAWLAKLPASFSGREALIVRQALDCARPIYGDQTLASGELVMRHVLETATILLELNVDTDTLVAAVLFRCPAFARDSGERIRATFGAIVSELMEGVVRMEQIGALSNRHPQPGKPQQQAAQLEALRKMLLAMVQDVRVVVIKLADHTQDLRVAVKHADSGWRRDMAELTRDIFAPLANRLGVWHLKWELEDLAFRILEPDTYRHVARLLDEKRIDRERYIEGVAAMLKGELARAGIEADVKGRPKHIYSIYRKMQRKGGDFEALHDVRAVRILVRDVKDCYAALGHVHNLWSPIPKEFDDYIAKPKSNNYRSLHTAVIGPEGKAVEVQIRTYEMHQHSELGVAAHWRYKEQSARDRSYDEKIAWLRQILEWKDEVRDAGELAEQFKTGLFEDSVYVLTPQGKVVDLPKDATPIDFAYHVHTELGHRCRGAKVNGVMVALNTPLQNGQQVEILAAKQGGPSRDWLNPALGYLKSPAARSKVRQWFNRQNYETAVAQGRTLLDKELQRLGKTAVNLETLAEDLGYTKVSDLLAGMGRGEVGQKQLQDVLRPPAPVAEAPEEIAVAPRKARSAASGSVLVVGVDRLLTVSAKCCKPVPPEPIIGFVTRGRGVTVHRADCVNVKRLDPERRVSAEWGEAQGATFPIDIMVEAVDRTGLLRDISEVLSREKINVAATSTASNDRVARMRFTIEIVNLDQLQRVLGLIRDVRGVVGAARR
jgi:GTP pyrophosphokinase